MLFLFFFLEGGGVIITVMLLSTVLTEDFLINMYFGAIYSHLNYFIEIWGCSAVRYMYSLLDIQKEGL